ncbi:uncharacterized protein [Nothobranchius furzeri]
MLGSAHEVQRFHRDADETKEWIEEKNQALNTDNYGHDLASVQALQREHEGFEHDLAALGDKVRFLIGTRTRVVSGDTFFMVLVTPPQPFLISNQRGAFLFKVDGGHNLTPEDCLSFGSNQPLVLPLVFLGLMLFRCVFALILDLPFFRIPLYLSLLQPTHTPTTGSLLNTSACLQWILKPEPMLTCVLPPPDAELLLQFQPQTYLCTLSSSL